VIDAFPILFVCFEDKLLDSIVALLLPNIMPPTVLNATAGTATVGWVSDPDGRGTFSLILSCLLTLGLCVWSAVHLNIPQKGEGQGEFWLRRVKWSLCGVLIPELVVLLAWRQQTSAARLTNEINKVIVDIEQKSASSNFAKRPKVPANHVSLRKNLLLSMTTN
jgi:hypothetical protein